MRSISRVGIAQAVFCSCLVGILGACSALNAPESVEDQPPKVTAQNPSSATSAPKVESSAAAKTTTKPNPTTVTETEETVIQDAPAKATPGIGKTTRDYGSYPKPAVGYVTDLAGLISADTIHELDGVLRGAEKDHGAEMAVLIVKSIQDYPNTANYSVEDFARGVYRIWQLGNPPSDRGILLLIAMREGESYVLFGKDFPTAYDKQAQQIMQDELLPRLKALDPDQAVKSCVTAMVRSFLKSKPEEESAPEEKAAPKATEKPAPAKEKAPAEEKPKEGEAKDAKP